MKTFDHLVVVDEETKRISIYRIYSDARKELYTYVDIPELSVNKTKDAFLEFSRLLGENILVDSPSARRLLRP